MLAAKARILLATILVGSVWTIGYLVAPTLFATLADRQLAGTIAGNLFRAEAWLSIACCGVLLLLVRWASDEGIAPKRRQTLMLLLVAMLACTLIGYFGLQPLMASLRAGVAPGAVMAADVKTQFGLLHGAAGILYLAKSLLGLALIFKIR